jgi:hypothetical protein
VTAAFCRHLGYRVQEADSDWVIGPDQAELQRALLDGWAAAAVEFEASAAARVLAWREAREAAIEQGRSRITVGHRDLAARPGTAAAGCGCAGGA